MRTWRESIRHASTSAPDLDRTGVVLQLSLAFCTSAHWRLFKFWPAKKTGVCKPCGSLLGNGIARIIPRNSSRIHGPGEGRSLTRTARAVNFPVGANVRTVVVLKKMRYEPCDTVPVGAPRMNELRIQGVACRMSTDGHFPIVARRLSRDRSMKHGN
jgi:hypothetical protein